MMDTQAIQKILPHRYPMLMVDRVESVTPGEKIVARKNVTINETIFQGHFPGNPTFPGVLIVEALAQSGAIAILTLPEYAGKTPYFGALNKVRFRQMVRPGDTLELTVTLDKLRGNAGKGHGEATVAGQVVCEAELTFAVE